MCTEVRRGVSERRTITTYHRLTRTHTHHTHTPHTPHTHTQDECVHGCTVVLSSQYHMTHRHTTHNTPSIAFQFRSPHTIHTQHAHNNTHLHVVPRHRRIKLLPRRDNHRLDIAVHHERQQGGSKPTAGRAPGSPSAEGDVAVVDGALVERLHQPVDVGERGCA